MATYSTIKGQTIQSFATDPYASEVLAGTWASGNDVNTIRSQTQGCGLLTAGLIAGGNGVPALPSTLGETEEYDGTSWAESGDLNTDRESPGVGGIQTAALCVAGYTTTYTAIVESYDGTSWTTSPATLNSPRTYNIVAGTSTAMITAGGGPGTQDITELWNGSTWTEVGDLNTGRSYFPGGGTSTAGICAGGESPATPQVGTAETWDGTSWTEVNALARAGTSSTRAAMAGNAPNSSTLFFGGSSPVVALTESYNGTSWTEVADMGAARDFGPGGGGSGTSAFWATGKSSPGTKVATTYEFSAPSTVSIAQEGQVWYNTASNVLKGFGKQGAGAWASANSLPVIRTDGGYCGTQTAGVFTGGLTAPPTSSATETYEYDGTSWTTSPAALGQGRNYLGSTGIGTQTAAQVFGGETPAAPGSVSDRTEQFNGSAWTEVADLTYKRIAIVGAGNQTAALAITGGHYSGAASTTYVESWDGTSWSDGTAAPNSKKYAMGGGTQTSAILAGGTQYPPSITNLGTSELWNGTAWTEEATLNTARSNGSRGAGSGTSAIIFGGAPFTAKTEEWNGSTWTELADMGSNIQANAGAGTASGAISVAGNSPPQVATVQEWTVGNATKTFTSS